MFLEEATPIEFFKDGFLDMVKKEILLIFRFGIFFL